MTSNDETSLFLLPRDYVLFKKIFIYLSLKDLYRIKCVCQTMVDVVDIYLELFCNNLDLSMVGSSKHFNADVFSKMTISKTNLSKLNLNNCKSWLKDEDFIPVIQQNLSLTFLSTYECFNLSNLAFRMIGNLNSLQELDVSFCRELSPDILAYIGTSLSTLTSLNISGCWNVTDSSLEIVAMHNKNLKYLHCSSCYALTDLSISTVAKRCVDLKVIDIRGCWRVKDISIIMFYEYCKHLEKVSVKDCTQITEVSIARLRPRGVVVDIEKPYDFLKRINAYVPLVQT